MARNRSLAGRVALVTGAGRGIGRAHAIELARRGAAVVVNDLGVDLEGAGRDPGLARAVVDDIVAAGGRAVADGADVASVEGGRAAVELARETFGRIDIVINNAGIAGGGRVESLEETAYDLQWSVHFKSTLGTTRAAFPHMKRQGWGRILNTVSEVALDARFGGGGPYGVAKAAVWAFTIWAAKEADGHGITVNAISPGARTRMSEVVFAAAGDEAFRSGSSQSLDLDPSHVARVAADLCGDWAGDINGRIVHAAAGRLREYTTSRTSRSDVVDRLMARAGLAD